MTLTAKMLRRHRIKAGLSQSEVADKIGCTPPFINRIENGYSPLPPGRTLQVAKALKIPKTDLTWAVKEDARIKIEKRCR